MALGSESVHGMWSSRLMFVLAAAGSAVGLGNIWRFPYVAGENGGGAFVLVYLGCIFLIGVPIMTAEILLGRAGRQSPINAMRDLVSHSNASPLWQVIGWMGALAGFMILSFYAVIAGWAMSYLFQMGSGTFTGTDAVYAAAAFNELTGDVVSVVGWHTVFMLMTIGIAARGVGAGLEATVKILMPALFFLLIVLVIYSAVTSGRFVDGLSFLFSFNIEKLTWDGVLMAMGQAFFTLSLGMGAIMAYGAYIPKDVSIISTARVWADDGWGIFRRDLLFACDFRGHHIVDLIVRTGNRLVDRAAQDDASQGGLDRWWCGMVHRPGQCIFVQYLVRCVFCKRDDLLRFDGLRLE
jgi:NSS family neurotransmitter:Na+ symporter